MKIVEHEKRLLKACLASESDFRNRFRSWEEIADLDALNYGAVRLIPYLKVRMDRQSISSSLKPKIDGIYRYFWAKRQVQMAAMEKHLSPLLKGTPALSLKGFAIEHLAYKQPELRPFDDFDILVSRADYFELSKRTANYEFRYAGPGPEQSTVYLRHARTFKAKNIEVDLHWTGLPVCRDHLFESRLFARAGGFGSGDETLLLSSATDSLLHTIVHGHRPNLVSPVRWYLDAFLLIQRNPIDWQLFWQEAEANGLTRQVKAGAIALNKMAEQNLIDIDDAPSGVRWTGLTRAAAIKSYFSATLWSGRLLRLLGSDVPMVRKALAMDGKSARGFAPYALAVRESMTEIRTVLQKNSLKSVITGSWFKR